MSAILQQGETAFGNTYDHIIQIPNHYIRKYDINIILYKLLNETQAFLRIKTSVISFIPNFLKQTLQFATNSNKFSKILTGICRP